MHHMFIFSTQLPIPKQTVLYISLKTLLFLPGTFKHHYNASWVFNNAPVKHVAINHPTNPHFFLFIIRLFI